jgi:hypothetical protein
MVTSSITQRIAQHYLPTAPVEATDFIDYFADITAKVFGILASLHILAPRFSPVLWFRGCREYQETSFPADQVSTIEKVRAKIEFYRKAMGIDSPVSFMLTKGDFTGVFQGISGIPGLSYPVIASGTNELEYFEEYLDGLLCHELAHIKNLDTLKVVPWALTILTVSAVVAPFFTGPFALVYEIGNLAFTLVSLSFLSRRFEKQADLDAAKTLGTARPLIDLFQMILQNHLEMKNETWLINEEGDHRLDILHPSLKERIRYLEEFEVNRTLDLQIVF